MSTLTQREITSGISRKALESLQRNRNVKPDAEPQKIVILETWCRQFVLLDFDHFNFALRDTIHLNDRPETVIFYLNRTELDALVRRGEELLRTQ